jgi:very-short-patch-repair endonuclease
MGHGCPKCKKSVGEDRVRKILKLLNIEFIEQTSFDGCKNKLPLRFDFYLPKHNIIIEYDGIDHFKPVTRSKNDNLSEKRFKMIQVNDKIKNNYCLTKNIKLCRISYYDFNIIDTIIKRELKS